MSGFIGLHICSVMTRSIRQQKCVRRMKTRLSEMEQAPIPSGASCRHALDLSQSHRQSISPAFFIATIFLIFHAPTTSWSSISAEPSYHERRATGRKQASPGVVVRGSVRVVASVTSRLHPFAGPELCPPDLTRWRALRSELNHRHEARCMQYRFRKSPESYLAALEEKLSKERLPP